MEKLAIIKSIKDKTKEINDLMILANELDVSIQFSQQFSHAMNMNHGLRTLDPNLQVKITETKTY